MHAHMVGFTFCVVCVCRYKLGCDIVCTHTSKIVGGGGGERAEMDSQYGNGRPVGYKKYITHSRCMAFIDLKPWTLVKSHPSCPIHGINIACKYE